LNKSITYLTALFIGMAFPLLANSQYWDCSTSSTYKNQILLKLNLNAGITSYFGDLSVYDINPYGKVIKESLPGFGIITTLQLTKTFGISGQVLQANLKATKEDISFKTRIFEYNIHGRINFLNLFNIPHDHDFTFEGYAGIGQFFYTVTKETTYSLYTDRIVYPVEVPEFVYFFGGGAAYRITKYTSLTVDLAIRQCQTDRLDDYQANDDFDYYSYFSMGLSIDIGRLINPYLKTRYRLK
jgi:hypothetical protein